MMKYTAIYVESFQSGSHTISMTKMRRIELQDGESVRQMLERENIANETQYLFIGHPLLQGED
jgi:hypothetical protein